MSGRVLRTIMDTRKSTITSSFRCLFINSLCRLTYPKLRNTSSPVRPLGYTGRNHWRSGHPDLHAVHFDHQPSCLSCSCPHIDCPTACRHSGSCNWAWPQSHCCLCRCYRPGCLPRRTCSRTWPCRCSSRCRCCRSGLRCLGSCSPPLLRTTWSWCRCCQLAGRHSNSSSQAWPRRAAALRTDCP
jgi:hypothetical protein